MDEVRSQLGVIEATLVPDSDFPSDTFEQATDSHDVSSEPSASDVRDFELLDSAQDRLTRLALNDPPPFAAESTGLPTSAPTLAPSSSSRPSRSTSVSGSRTSNTTSPTSLVDSEGEGGFEDDLSLLKSLFPSA